VKKKKMRTKNILVIGVISILLISVVTGLAIGKKGDCTTIQDGITYSAGHYLADELLTTGFDIFRYNYQGHLFEGSYANAYLGRDGFPPYEGDDEVYLEDNPGAELHWTWDARDVKLQMKWNDAWLSNKDCNGDGKLDRHYGYDRYIGSGAWLTNHQSGTYENEEGETCKWNYFVKIVAVPEDATVTDGIWYAEDGTEIGPEIWSAFAIIQEVENDPCAGLHGIQYKTPASPGLGCYKP
jgi:hypothetical protein